MTNFHTVLSERNYQILPPDSGSLVHGVSSARSICQKQFENGHFHGKEMCYTPITKSTHVNVFLRPSYEKFAWKLFKSIKKVNG
jgi:hypothetical protein